MKASDKAGLAWDEIRLRTAERADEAARRRLAGETLQSIGDTWGISREAVRQLIRQHRELHANDDPLSQPGRRRARLEREFARRARVSRPCIVCGYWVLRGEGSLICCSEECTRIRERIGWRLSPERYESVRRSSAKWIQEHAAEVSRSRVLWAERVLAGTAKPNRRFVISDDVRAAIARAQKLRSPSTSKEGSHLR